MNGKKRLLSLVGSLITILFLVFDGKTAIYGASKGVSVCIGSVIPSLFPFITISYIFNGVLSGISYKPVRFLFRICGVPRGGESLLILGLSGGYPVGAQAVNDAYRNNYISKTQARRLLAFCNNAGPAFVFGVVSCLFENKRAVWALWGVHMLSAVMVALIIPKENLQGVTLEQAKLISLPEALRKSVYTVANICGWIVLFATFGAFTEKYVSVLLPEWANITSLGVMELTNGIYCLLRCQSEAVRFLFAAVFLGFGGFCVMMQTASVTKDSGMGLYFPGKLAQCAISYYLALFVSLLLFGEFCFSLLPALFFYCILLFSVLILRKNSRFMRNNAV